MKLTEKLQKSRRLSFRLYRKLAIAAVAVIALGVGMYYFVSIAPTRLPESVLADIQPGGVKATLVMADGKEVVLDRERSLNILEKDGTEIRKDSLAALIYGGCEEVDTQSIKADTPVFNTIKVPVGGEFNLVLSDGTRVWLNSDSEFRFPTRFSEETREVYIQGEVYLEVRRDSLHPFIVHAGEANVRVLGTSFNVKAYRGDEEVVATLVSGKVEVDIKGKVTELIPGEQAIWDRKEDRFSTRDVDVSHYISWMKGIFEFEDLSLSEITAQLSRWYDVKFMFEDEACAARHFTGGIKRYVPLVEFLQVIEQTTSVKFEFLGRTIVVKSNSK